MSYAFILGSRMYEGAVMQKVNTERSSKRRISYDTVVFHTFVAYINGVKTVFTLKQNYLLYRNDQCCVSCPSTIDSNKHQ